MFALQTLDFDPDGFAPFLPQAVAQLMSLIGEANTFDSKRKVDDALNVVIDRAGKQVCTPHELTALTALTRRCSVQIIPLVPLITGPIPELCKLSYF